MLKQGFVFFLNAEMKFSCDTAHIFVSIWLETAVGVY